MNVQNAALASAPVSLSDAQFKLACELIRELTGINMSDAKRQLVTRRISGRMRSLNIDSVSDYIEFLQKGGAGEVELFTNAVTTNLTSFFREKHHFEELENVILPEIISLKRNKDKRLRIWSAGCSTGEESYSIAMTVLGLESRLAGWDVKILCTDVDTEVLATASAGMYPAKRVETVPADMKRKWLEQVGDNYQVTDRLRSIMTFKPLNLMREWPMRGPFDIVFCRNVVIYFDKPTQRVLMARYADLIADHGYLILGHSESLHNVSKAFSLVGRTVYKKQ